MKTWPLTFRPDMLRANRELWKWATRRLVKSGNSMVLPGTFEGLDLSTGRARRVLPALTEIRAQCAFRGGPRVVTVTPRILPGDLIWTRAPGATRAASRQTLTIQAVRACRIQDMTDADALAEGIIAVEGLNLQLAPRLRFALLWDRINGSGSWAENPWCWVYEYSVTDRNIDKVYQRPQARR